MIKVEIDYDPRIRGMSCYIIDEKMDGSVDIYQPTNLIVTHYDKFPQAEVIEPTFRFCSRAGTEFLQEFANALSKCGFKPTELEESKSEISAIKYHLEDMRKLVFKGIKF